MISIEILRERLKQLVIKRKNTGYPIDGDVQNILKNKVENLSPLELRALSVGNCDKLLECGYFCGKKRANQCETNKEFSRLVLEQIRTTIDEN